eukprot:TRINITY_DN18503_c0_g1_i1.p1 TRINITY_DN18503_c0_g1~~TRINITY_DN18503_c0_g1_i1.p1  ORF type:complete len:157 (+),score=30.23 TRINITY_DN18503_c0_g1_i1:41-472(+)
MQTEEFRKWEQLLEQDYQRECEKQSARMRTVVRQKEFFKSNRLPAKKNRLRVMESAEREDPPPSLIPLSGRGLTTDNMEWIQRRIRLSEAADLEEQKTQIRGKEWRKSQDVTTDARLTNLQRRRNRNMVAIEKNASRNSHMWK